MTNSALISVHTCVSHLSDPAWKIIDASWFLPGSPKTGEACFGEKRIPGAIFLDIEEVKDSVSPYPHMLPSSEVFAEKVGKLGISEKHHVIVYDQSAQGIFSSARVWWMFKIFGHASVYVLDGGWNAWMRAGCPVEIGEPRIYPPSSYNVSYYPTGLASMEDVRANLDHHAVQVVDARTPGRFAGTEPEPRPHLRAGHIPGSINFPWQGCLTPDGLLKSQTDLKQLFAEKHIAFTQHAITSCGSGVTAAIVFLALWECGHRHLALYDGSAAEWLDPSQNNPVSQST